MRIIAGALKGRRLVTPRGDTTRPTTDQVRIALMDTLMPRLPDARVLDLFAGAGGVGLEALSRGAAHATFVERDARAVAALRENVETLGVGALTHVRRGDVLRELPALYHAGERFDVVFLDPPYDEPDLAGAVTLGVDLLTAGGICVLEHASRRAAPEAAGVPPARRLASGDSALAFYGG